jgi:hypothetical protein
MLDFREEGKLLHLYVDGLLTTRDYIDFVPVFERFEDLGSPPFAMLVELGPSFTGWNLGPLLGDGRPDVAHRNTFDRIAVVGDAKWNQWLTASSGLVFAAENRFFERHKKAEAENWARGGIAGDATPS